MKWNNTAGTSSYIMKLLFFCDCVELCLCLLTVNVLTYRIHPPKQQLLHVIKLIIIRGNRIVPKRALIREQSQVVLCLIVSPFGIAIVVVDHNLYGLKIFGAPRRSQRLPKEI